MAVPVALEITLYMPKPRKPARCYPVRPDWDNGGKSTGDALQGTRRKVAKTGRVIRAALPGLAYEEDSQVCDGRVRKTWVGMSAGTP